MTRNKSDRITPQEISFGDTMPAAAVDYSMIPDPRQDLPAALTWYRNAVKTALAEYQVENDVDDLRTMKQLQWNHTLQYIRDRVFKRNGKLVYPLSDPIIIDRIAELYINTCYGCSKSVSLAGFAEFSGISYATIQNWSTGKTKTIDIYIDKKTGEAIPENYIDLYKVYYPGADIVRLSNNLYGNIVEKLRYARQHTLQDKAEDGSVMSLALGKIEYGWEEGKRAQVQAAAMEKYALPDDLIAEYDK